MAKLKVKSSPRLYIEEEVVFNLKAQIHGAHLSGIAKDVLKDANVLVKSKPIAEGEGKTYQMGTRAIDTQLACLTTAWSLTHDQKYRKAAIRHLGNLMNWTHISCEARFNSPKSQEFMFCLSYGEHAATIGFMYDVFRPEMIDEEKAVFFDVFDRFYMKAALRALESTPWWANQEWSNWNGVCAGGMGIMALALYEDHPDARKLIPFVEKSLGEYFKSYISNGGGNHEGTGYWNYGMNYSLRYLLGWESATGKQHPAFKIPELAKTLYFPLDFTGITFGDNDGWGPTPFFFLVAERLKEPKAALAAATYFNKPSARKKNQKDKNQDRKNLKYVERGEMLYVANQIPTDEEMVKLKKQHENKPAPVARVYDGLGWAALADDIAYPKIRLAARGGSSEVSGHGMVDLLSFRCRVNEELMITDQPQSGYLAPTFTRRGTDLYERSAASKSTLFVDGLGCFTNMKCDVTEVVQKKGVSGIRIDGSHIYLPRWKDKFIGRLFLLVENSYWLVIDRLFEPNPAESHYLEARFHTLAYERSGRDWVKLKSGKERMTMSFSGLGKGSMQQSLGMPSAPHVTQSTIMRWMTSEPSHDLMLVTAMNPGAKKLGLEVKKIGNVFQINVSKPDGKSRRIRLNTDLSFA
jgi:hypothetical protein